MDVYSEYSVRTKYRKINARVKDRLSVIAESVNMLQTDNAFEPLHNDIQIESNCQSEGECENDLDDEDTSVQFQNDEDELNNDSDSNNNSDSSHNESYDTRSNLTQWALQFNVSHACLSGLLDILIKSNLDLPSDPRTLLSTPKQSNVISIAGGSYYHFGIANTIQTQLEHSPWVIQGIDTLTLRINIDGLPLHRSNNEAAWPILGMLKELPKSVFMIGLFCGVGKPSSVQAYLNEFVRDAKDIIARGIDFQGKHVHISLPDAVICDAPARAFVKCIKGHTGYYGCERCTQKGLYLSGKMTFPETHAPLRTDLQFRGKTQIEHHNGDSPLVDLGIDCVSGVVLDYMHLVCLGVTRKLIFLWTQGPLKCRISAGTTSIISRQLLTLRESLPRVFSRKPRSLTEFKQWKATEFRQFLLYTGPVVLCSNLPIDIFNNFMLLSIAMRILLSPALCKVYCDYAQDLLQVFVTNFSQIYGKDMLVYNVHSLTHLANDARKYGALDSVSCFPFENYLGQVKKMVRRPQNPLAQIVRRLTEKQHLVGAKHEEQHKHPHLAGPLPAQYTGCQQYKAYKDIRCSLADNCFGLKDKVILIRNILFSPSGKTFAVCEDFERQETIFKYPLDCSNLGICVVSKLSGKLQVVSIEQLSHKYVRLPFEQKFIVFPQLHDC